MLMSVHDINITAHSRYIVYYNAAISEHFRTHPIARVAVRCGNDMRPVARAHDLNDQPLSRFSRPKPLHRSMAP